jgi:RNA polymerase sigma-70 factor (ECF subfamily)
MYEDHLVWTLNTVRRLGVPERDLEDVTHDVFATVWRRLDSFRRGSPIKPWLLGIAFRVVSNRLARSASKSERLTNDLPERPGGIRPDEHAEAEQTRQHVIAALEQLELDQRAIFVGHDIEGIPVPELAASLEVPVNTAYSRLRLARQHFERTLESRRRGAR